MSTISTTAAVGRRTLRRRMRRVRRRIGHDGVGAVRRIGEHLSAVAASPAAESYAGPAHLAAIRQSFVPDPDLSLVDGAVPLIWWTDTENFGDLLSPWLVGRMTRRPVRYAPPREHSYVAVGSVVTRARQASTVWGSGSFGSERRSLFKSGATYRAVRGPLTRSRLLDAGIDCPRVYGDPALLMPVYFWPKVEKTHEIGVVIRHSEHRWRDTVTGPGVRLIDFGSGDIEQVVAEMLSCRRIVSSSLHGLVIADAYGIPNAWLGADGDAGGSRPNGGEFKYHDYFASVGKLREPHYADLRSTGLTVASIDAAFEFDDRPIDFDHEALLAASPFVSRAA